MTHRIHLLYDREDIQFSQLQALLDPRFETSIGKELPQLADFEILVAGRPTAEQIEASPHLLAVVIPFAGVPPETKSLLSGYPAITVHNLHHNADATAEMAMALLMSAAKCIVPIDRAFRSNDWRPRYRPNPSVLLKGKNATILGYGDIGRRVARMCLALGMSVRAIRKSMKGKSEESNGVTLHSASDLDRLLPQSDVLIVCLPLTEETHGLLDAGALSALPQGAIVVNVGRGPIIEEEALFQALKSGHLHAAGLDVWYNYPNEEGTRADTPPSNWPFAELDNVVMSPHRAGGSQGNELLRVRALAALLNPFAEGGKIANRVDLDAGY
jgi:phosphoglycerate dehydrogenase-like enzyme